MAALNLASRGASALSRLAARRGERGVLARRPRRPARRDAALARSPACCSSSATTPADDLLYLYLLLPVAVSIIAEQLRLASAQTVLDQRELEDAQAVGRAARGASRRRSCGRSCAARPASMTIAAFVIAFLALRVLGTADPGARCSRPRNQISGRPRRRRLQLRDGADPDRVVAGRDQLARGRSRARRARRRAPGRRRCDRVRDARRTSRASGAWRRRRAPARSWPAREHVDAEARRSRNRGQRARGVVEADEQQQRLERERGTAFAVMPTGPDGPCDVTTRRRWRSAHDLAEAVLLARHRQRKLLTDDPRPDRGERRRRKESRAPTANPTHGSPASAIDDRIVDRRGRP